MITECSNLYGNPTRQIVLAVDDVALNLAVIKKALEPKYQVLIADSGPQALRLAVGDPRPELILLDIMMPLMDGYEVLSCLRQDKRTSDIPVIFVTAMTDEDDEREGLQLGASDYITKPVRTPILQARVQTHLELKHSRDLLQQQNQILESEVQEQTRSLHLALKEQTELNRRLEEAHLRLLQSEKMVALGQLAAGVAHEINNPISFVHSNLGSLNCYATDLMAIIRAAESASENLAGTPSYAEYLKIKRDKDFDFLCDDLFSLVRESIDGLDRVTRIVSNLKNFSREGETQWEWANLHACLDPTLNIVWHILKHKCQVIKNYAPDLPDVLCIPSQLNQVFMNLLVNGAQAVESQGVITISTSRYGDHAVCVRITDTGKGIPSETVSRIFDPFFTTKPVGMGTGLGLSISWGIVSKHKGRIEVESTPGEGSCFTVLLPIDPNRTSFEQPGSSSLS